MRHYSTLFDAAYLTRGLVLYESLKRHSGSDFVLHVLAMDYETEMTLRAMDLPQVEIVPVGVLENLLRLQVVRHNRTWQEYCWTMASVFTSDLMEYGLLEVTYLDADMMFFSDPEVIFEEMRWRSIAVIPHRLIPSKRHLEVNGKFNVSWVTFKGDIGRECVRMWAAQCRQRCSAEVGCGDQLYLDEWPDKYGAQLCVIENIGAGLAPWNLANYEIGIDKNSQLWASEMREWCFRPVVFYHYHEFMERKDGTFRLTNYDLRDCDRRLIYAPYLEAYTRAKVTIAHASMKLESERA
jgi:hypothetical protein